MGDLEDRPDTCGFRVLTATSSSAAIGTVAGAVVANWADVPKVLKGKALPALVATGRVMGVYGATFAAIGAAFSAVDCIAESARGRKDAWNGVLGGAAAGAVLGMRVGSAPLGVGAGAAYAAMSAMVDTSGHKLRGSGGIDDGATPPTRLFPSSD